MPGKGVSFQNQGAVEQLNYNDEEMGPDVPVVEELVTPVYVHDMPEFEVIEEEELTEDEEQQVPDDEFYPKMRAVSGLATPSVTCTVASFAREIINMYFVSHIADTNFILALGLGNVLMNTSMVPVCISLSSSMENFVSQALATGKL